MHSVVPAPSLELLSLCQYCVSLKLLIGWCNGETFPSRESSFTLKVSARITYLLNALENVQYCFYWKPLVIFFFLDT